MNDDPLLTVRDFMLRVGLSERTVRGMLADGRLPAVRLIGLRAVRIPASAVLALIGEAKVPAGVADEGEDR